MQQKICLFDFDGTLTTQDTLLAFIRYACGNRRFWKGLLLYSPLLVLMKLHLYPNYRAKQHLFGWFFGGMNIEEFDQLCHHFAQDRAYLLRQAGITRMQQVLNEGQRVFIVSASIDNWVRPFFEHMHACSHPIAPIEVLGTKIEIKNGCLTGRFSTPNCYGAEKVRRVKEVLTEKRSQYFITAFGDSRGDKEMLKYADQGFYRPFKH